MSGSVKTILLILSIILGLFIPQVHNCSFLIRYFLMGMLFFAFLDTDFHKEIVSIRHLFVIMYIIGVAIAAYFLTVFINHDLALGLFLAAIAPTAIASVPLIGYLGRDTGFMTFSVLSTNICIALILPFLLPLIIGVGNTISFYEIVIPILTVIFIPLLCALVLKHYFARVKTFLKSFEIISYFFFVTNIFLAMSRAGFYLRTEFNSPLSILISMAIGVFVLTTMNFSIGWLIGKPRFARETSNSIGQKNTMFVIWVALTFVNPVVALAPMMYTIYQNLYISSLLYKTN